MITEKQNQIYGGEEMTNVSIYDFLKGIQSYEIYGKNIDICSDYGVISLRENGRIIIA